MIGTAKVASLLFNPWVLLGIGIALASSHTYVGYKAYQIGGDRAKLACELRVSDLQSKYEAQKKRVDELNKQWQATLDAYIEGEAKRAQERQSELDAAHVQLEEYEAKLSAGKSACILDKSDIDSVR